MNPRLPIPPTVTCGGHMAIRPIPNFDAVVLEIQGASGLRLFRVIEHWTSPLLQASLAEWIDRDARFLVHHAFVY